MTEEIHASLDVEDQEEVHGVKEVEDLDVPGECSAYREELILTWLCGKNGQVKHP